MIKDITYKDYSKKSDIHGTVLYPATMIAPVQNDFLNKIMSTESIESIFDPFYGSGTSLYEAMLINNKVRLVGCDINPLAHLITETKLNGININSIENDIKELELCIEQIKADDFTFDNIDKWFRMDVADDLRIIRLSVMVIENERNRKYFWCMLSDIIRRYSNTRSSTYKLHIKEQQHIDNMENNVISDFLKSIHENIYFYNKNGKNIELYKEDTLLKMLEFKNGVFDISITSPPYGDNQTTVTYGQFSSLALKWIDSKDLKLEGWELNNYSIIDSNSMGGSVKPILLNKEKLEILNPYTSKIGDSKQRKVLLFFNDYFRFLDELCRVTDKYIVMTLGNRRVDNKLINLTRITSDYLELKGFRNESKISRRIPNKRMPRRTSSVNNKSVSSMNKEYVIVHKKIV